MNAVIVDDSRAMRLIVARMLRRAGYTDVVCHEASSGREAFSLVRRLHPALVLSDWHMPDGDGLELLKKLRSVRSKAVFGFITADATPQMRELAITTGAQFLVAKPFDADTLREAIEAAMA